LDLEIEAARGPTTAPTIVVDESGVSAGIGDIAIRAIRASGVLCLRWTKGEGREKAES